MFPRFKHILLFVRSDLFLPLFLIFIYVLFLLLARSYIPTSDELVKTFASLYSKYGYEIIFTASMLEALILINFFVPGQIAMAMGAIFASTGQVELTLVVLFASLGATSGYILDYLLGYFGFSDILKKLSYGSFIGLANKQLKSLGNRGLILGFIHPTSGSFLALASGMIKINFLRFLLITILSTVFWLSLWGILFYIIGDALLILFTRYSFFILLLIVGGLFLTKLWKSNNKST